MATSRYLRLQSGVVNAVRDFFLKKKNYTEIFAQKETNILSACENPHSSRSFVWRGEEWSLPQTSQTYNEMTLQKYPELFGVFSSSTSYRDERPEDYIEGRHAKTGIFDACEYELLGGIDELAEIHTELMAHLGFRTPDGSSNFPRLDYLEMCDKYNTPSLENEHEAMMEVEYGPVVLLCNFPKFTHPFFSMQRFDEDKGDRTRYKKIDVIVGGMEVIGSSERSCDVEQMREDFMTLENGNFSKVLFDRFGEERVLKELDEFLSVQRFKTSGGGVGVMRLIKAIQKYNLADRYI